MDLDKFNAGCEAAWSAVWDHTNGHPLEIIEMLAVLVANAIIKTPIKEIESTIFDRIERLVSGYREHALAEQSKTTTEASAESGVADLG